MRNWREKLLEVLSLYYSFLMEGGGGGDLLCVVQKPIYDHNR